LRRCWRDPKAASANLGPHCGLLGTDRAFSRSISKDPFGLGRVRALSR
jgi:hypothetical protein